MRNPSTPLPLAARLCAGSCMSLDYDLSTVPVPVSAKPAKGPAEPFEIEARRVLRAHGLFGRKTPDVAALLREESEGYDRVAGLRVCQESNFHQWLLTHLTLSLVRMRTVVIEGELVRDEPN